MVSLTYVTTDRPPSAGAGPAEREAAEDGFYFCPPCEVYGMGTECWWCGRREVRWMCAPEQRALPAAIHAGTVLPSWARSPHTLARWMFPRGVQDEVWTAR